MTHFPHHPRPASTDTFPVIQRSGIRFFRRVSRGVAGAFEKAGAWVYFLRDIGRAFGEPATYGPETIRQMKNIGVDSLPLTAIVAGFIGSVVALQTRYQMFPGVQLSLVGLATRQMVILELGPLLTGLVLAGRVGARMTAEIGTMRVTEQIDALETLAYDPVAFLVLPRLLAAIIMLPVLTVFADAVGITSGYLMGVYATGISPTDFKDGLKLGYGTFQVIYSLLKATMFGGAISFFSAYEGYIAEAGAEGVGRSTATAVVITSVAILVLDALTAVLLAPYLQS
ncbi:MAG TPA: ABC transporter permease [Gemmatimonadaceae bacterium]